MSDNTEAATPPPPLTLEGVRAAMDMLRPIVYYATSEAIERGKVLQMKETDYTHEAVLFHPEDEARIRQELPEVRWVHLRDAPMKERKVEIKYEPEPIEFRVYRRWIW